MPSRPVLSIGKTLTIALTASALVAGSALSLTAAAGESAYDDELLSIQREFDQASFGDLDGSRRKQAFEALVEHAAEFSGRYPDRVEAVAWNGIVLSTYAGEVSALGALYAKVPGGLVGFGDDELAAGYFVKALAVDEDNIDANYFYGEFLLEQEDFSSAARVLRRALGAPGVDSRPLFDSGRRAEIQALLARAEQH